MVRRCHSHRQWGGESLVKFYSSSEAGSEPGTAYCPLGSGSQSSQGTSLFARTYAERILEGWPWIGVCPTTYSQQDSVVFDSEPKPHETSSWFSFLLLDHMNQHKTSSDPLQRNVDSRTLCLQCWRHLRHLEQETWVFQIKNKWEKAWKPSFYNEIYPIFSLDSGNQLIK